MRPLSLFNPLALPRFPDKPAQFRQHHEGQEDVFGRLQPIDGQRLVGAEIPVPIGVDDDSQGQSSGSTWSIASMA